MECGQTMHEYCVFVCHAHQLGIYLIRRQLCNTLCPYLCGLTHGYPNVGIDNVGILYALCYILA